MATTCMSSANRLAGRVLGDFEHTRFKQNGFLILHELAPQRDLEQVRVILDSLFEQTDRECGVLDHALDRAPQLKDSLVFQSCERIAKQVLGPSAAVSFDQALYKPPYERDDTRWNQDQAFQGQYRPMNTLHFWIPLQPVTELNGCLHFIPGSHLLGLLPHYQCRVGDPFALTPRYLPAVDAVACPLNLGDATCHLPLTLHRALPNSTGSMRRAWALLFRPFGRFGRFDPIPCLKQCLQRCFLPR
jgi:phytanoyl-CoA dioxygenase PhyH